MGEAEAALADARRATLAALDPAAVASASPVTGSVSMPPPLSAAVGAGVGAPSSADGDGGDGERPVTIHATSENIVPSEDVDHAALPAMLPDSAVMPWLHRRLHLTSRAAARVGLAGRALRDVVR